MTSAAHLRYSAIAGDEARFLERSYYGFGPIYKHLSATLDHQKRPESIPFAYWSEVDVDLVGDTGEGVWVALHDRRGRELADGLSRHFFDEYTNRVVPTEPLFAGSSPLPRTGELDIVDRDEREGWLCLSDRPHATCLAVPPNANSLQRQQEALRQLQNVPQPEHRPLLELVQPYDERRWGPIDIAERPTSWHVLTDMSRPGTDQQRRFVEKALNTPDFALLEGPPGSGKTTTICELVSQLVLSGKRVLLCAPTHVAVDNVLERLDELEGTVADHLVALRIGKENKVSSNLTRLQINHRVATEGARLREHLTSLEKPTLAQERLRDAVLEGDDGIERLILNAANVVCGTTIGILQHPDIKRAGSDRRAAPLYDVLILDEASMTKFQEFLAPAVLAKRWVLIGDRRQLSPYTSDQEVAAGLAETLETVPELVASALDFHVLKDKKAGVRTVVLQDNSPEWTDCYRAAAARCGVDVHEFDGTTDELPEGLVLAGKLPPATPQVRLRRPRPGPTSDDEIAAWCQQVGWRLVTSFELRLNSGLKHHLDRQLAPFIPSGDNVAERRLLAAIERVRRVALPSVLESLQVGVGTHDRNDETVLTRGLPTSALDSRHERLTYQFRMHPDISAFPREHFYDSVALNDPPDMAAERTWDYQRFTERAGWIHVPRVVAPEATSYANPAEARRIVEEVSRFHDWVQRHPSRSDRSVAVLCFYRDQVAELRRQLRALVKGRAPYVLGDTPPFTRVHLETVNRFQGQEADLVFLSVALDRTTHFTRSPNRLNVGLTRARYQLVIVGDRNALRRGRTPSALSLLATDLPYDLTVDGDRR